MPPVQWQLRNVMQPLAAREKPLLELDGQDDLVLMREEPRFSEL
jgi:hypothetical protein